MVRSTQPENNQSAKIESMSDGRKKVVVVMPAYNAAKTLRMTYAALPHDMVDLVILVDDGSKDETVRIAKNWVWNFSSTTGTTATAPIRRPVTGKPCAPKRISW